MDHKLCQMFKNSSHVNLATICDTGNIIIPVIQVRKLMLSHSGQLFKVTQSELSALMC